MAVTGLDRLRGYARRMDELHVWPGGARLREIAGQIERELARQDKPVPTDNGPSPSPVTDEDNDALTWVREHGGLDTVKKEWRSRVPYDKHERERQRLLDHIAECETALRRRNVRIEELGRRVSDLTSENAELRRRAMPEGIEWPRYDTGEPVRIGNDGVRVVELFEDEYRLWGDGEPVSEEPIATGPYGEHVRLSTKPEIDSWERIEDDALNFVEDNAGIPHDQDQMERDMLAILRRCKALAKRGE